jgi:lipoprotein NlpI
VRLLKDELPADRFASYKTLFGKLGPRLVYTVSAPALSQARMDRLRQEAATVQGNISRGKLALATNTQVNATYRAMLLSAQLDEGRLNPALRAEVLTARGIQLDHLGRIKEAKADFAAALALSSDSMETLNAAATNAMMAGDYGQVVGFANRVLKTRPNDGEARQSRALAKLYSQDYVSAKSDFEELVKDGDQIQRGYPLVWLGILAQRDGRQPMEAISAFRDSQLPRAWPRPLVDWMRGTKSLDELLADARKGEAAKEQLTEAYYYVGERYLAQGDVNRASDYFRKTLELKVVEFIEYGAALNRLAALKP